MDEGQLLSRVHFAFDSDQVSEVDLAALKKTARVFRTRPHITIRLDGHTDERGSAAYNRELARRRVTAVRAALIAEGIAPERIQAFTYGDHLPRVKGSDELAYTSNRRVPFDEAVADRADFSDVGAWVLATVHADWKGAVDRIREADRVVEGAARKVTDLAVMRLDAGAVFSIVS